MKFDDAENAKAVMQISNTSIKPLELTGTAGQLTCNDLQGVKHEHNGDRWVSDVSPGSSVEDMLDMLLERCFFVLYIYRREFIYNFAVEHRITIVPNS